MRVILAHKNFAAMKSVSHIGLGVAAINTAKCLRRAGIQAEAMGIISAPDLAKKLNDIRFAKRISPLKHVTHVVISAPWIEHMALLELINEFPEIEFAVSCHSNVGFLQADRNGVARLREAIDLEMGSTNFIVAANSRRFGRWIRNAYGRPCGYLPNLYWMDADPPKYPTFKGGVLRIGSFSATRAQKNLASAVGAAIEISRQLKVPLEMHVSVGRDEGGGGCILQAVREMVRGLPTVTLVENPWSTWYAFTRLVSSMNLCIQPSYTESFSMVAADAISHGVPVVCSDAIDWAPKYYKAETDDVFEIAHVGRALLNDFDAVTMGVEALKTHNADGLTSWKGFLKKVPQPILA